MNVQQAYLQLHLGDTALIRDLAFLFDKIWYFQEPVDPLVVSH